MLRRPHQLILRAAASFFLQGWNDSRYLFPTRSPTRGTGVLVFVPNPRSKKQ